LESGFIKLKRIVLTPGITRPANNKSSAGPRKIRSANGRAFFPLARPAIIKIKLNTIKKAAIAVKMEPNLGKLAERNSDTHFASLWFWWIGILRPKEAPVKETSFVITYYFS